MSVQTFNTITIVAVCVAVGFGLGFATGHSVGSTSGRQAAERSAEIGRKMDEQRELEAYRDAVFDDLAKRNPRDIMRGRY